MLSYICPNCKRRQTSVVVYQTVIEFWNFDLKRKEYTDKLDKEGGEIEGYQCPECGADLPSEKFDKILVN